MTKDTPLRDYTYPLSTEKIAAGATNIEELAEDVENSRALATNKHTSDTLYTSYPVGHSQMYVSGGDGWPYNYGNVITIYTTGSNGWQWFYPYNTTVPVQVRLGTATGWGDWLTVASSRLPGAYKLENNEFKAATAMTSYPPTQSIMYVSGSGVADGWPTNYGNVVTIYTTGSNGYQWFYPYTNVPTAYLRNYSATVGDWSTWNMVVGNNSPNAIAAGAVNVTPAADSAKAVTISLPSGRFEAESTGGALRVQLTAGGATRPQDIAVCTYSVTTSTLVAYVYRKSATPVSLSWQVSQGGAVR